MVHEEEEHRKRLDLANSFFQNALETSEYSSKDTGKEFELKVVSYFHDYWSVIRNNTVKFLSKILTKLRKDQIDFFLTEFHKSFTDENRSWQDIHGSLQGFTAVIPVLDEPEIDKISHLCFKNIGHVRNPIRDTCKDCLVKICNKSKSAKTILIQILRIIKENSSSHLVENEYDTLRLDGLLHCISEVIPLLDKVLFQSYNTLFSPFNSPHRNLLQTTPEEPNLSLKEFLNIIKSSMLHNASTVRQKAGTIISKLFHSFLMKKSTKNSSSWASLSASLDDPRYTSSPSTSTMMNEETNDIINFIIDNLLIQILNIHSLEHWNGHEVCLMICEELIRDFLNIFFTYCQNISLPFSPRSNKPNDGPMMEFVLSLPILEINKLLHFIHDELVILLCHPRFEVRRMILQLIPTAVRGKIVIDCLLSDFEYYSQSSAMSSPALSIRARSITEDDSYEKHLKRASLNRHFLPMVEMIWISSMIKENRHFQEVFNQVNSSMMSSNSSTATSMPFNGDYWSTEVHGRLLEVELRNEFHSNLLEVMKNISTHSFIIKALLINDLYILELIEHYLNKIDQNLHLSEPHSAASSQPSSTRNSLRRNQPAVLPPPVNFEPNVLPPPAPFGASSSSKNPDSMVAISEKYISMDFVEFYCLVECFLHNIKERSYSGLDFEDIYPPQHNVVSHQNNHNHNPYVHHGPPMSVSKLQLQSPKLLAQQQFQQQRLSPISSIVLISQSMKLLEQIKPHGLAWISILSYLQYATHQKSLGNVTPHSKHMIFHQQLDQFTIFPTDWSLKLLDLLFQEKSESCKHKNSFLILKYWKMGYEMSGIRILPTLTDPATNPLIYADENVLSKSFDESDEITTKILQMVVEDEEAAKAASKSQQQEEVFQERRPISVKFSPTATVFRSATEENVGDSENVPPSLPPVIASDSLLSYKKNPNYLNLINPPSVMTPGGVLPLNSPNKLGVGSNMPVMSNINSFQSMNRWNCEAISPLLFSLSCNLTNMEIVLLLSAVVSEWILFNFIDPLWLDNRRYIKRILFESLPNFLLTIIKQLPLHKYQNEYRLLLFYMIGMIMEIFEMILTNSGNNTNPSAASQPNVSFSSSSASGVMDAKCIQPMIKSCITIIQMLFDFTPAVYSELNSSYHLLEDDENQTRLYEYSAGENQQSGRNNSNKNGEEDKEIKQLIEKIQKIMISLKQYYQPLQLSASSPSSPVPPSYGSPKGLQHKDEKNKSLFYDEEEGKKEKKNNDEIADEDAETKQEEVEQNEEDDFSDWDEDEETSTTENLNIFTNTNQMVMLSSMLADLEYLQRQTDLWLNRLEYIKN
jgi:hypothetical protein